MKFTPRTIAIGVLGGVGLVSVYWYASQSVTSTPVNQSHSSVAESAPAQNEVKEAVAPPVAVKGSVQDKLAVLDQILSSHDDNDIRMDTELKVLSEQDKHAFMDKYRALPMEDRNGRGTVIFLIGRNLTTPEDFKFISSIFLEPYCRSLENCTQGPKDEEAHHSSGDEVTQSYPQWAAIKALEKWSQSENSELKQHVLDALKAAEGFDHPKIQAYARQLFVKLGG